MSSRRSHAKRKRHILRSVVFLDHEYRMICRKEKKKNLNDIKIVSSDSSYDCDDRTQEREIHRFFSCSCRTQKNVGVERFKRF
jgi:hypothetical protein